MRQFQETDIAHFLYSHRDSAEFLGCHPRADADHEQVFGQRYDAQRHVALAYHPVAFRFALVDLDVAARAVLIPQRSRRFQGA